MGRPSSACTSASCSMSSSFMLEKRNTLLIHWMNWADLDMCWWCWWIQNYETWNIMNIIWISWIKIVEMSLTASQQLGWPTCPLISHRPLQLAAHPPVQKPVVMPFGIQASGGVQSWPKLAENSPLLKTFWVPTRPCYMSIPCFSRSCLIDSSTHIRCQIHYSILMIHSVIQIIDAISTATICYNIYPVAHLRHFPSP